MVRRLLFVLLQLIPFAALAGAASPQGVWSGTVGAKAIVACFNKGSPWTAYGSYYYIDYLTPIPLHTQEEDTVWHEGDTAKWELTAQVNGVILGTWRNEKTGKALPISLTLVDGNDDESACARDSYNSRLESKPKIEKGKIVQFSARRSYRKLRFAGQETIELIGPDPALDKINSLLELDQSKEALDAYFQQRREFLGRVGYPGVDERRTEPKYWDSNFITIEFYLWVAGEGRSGISNEYRTWNSRTGEEIDLWNWIGSSSKDAKLPPKLKKYLYRSIKEEASKCANGYRGEGVFTLTLDKAGLHIDEDSWGDGCEKMFFISYQKLGPFLSPAGKQAVKSIMGLK
jgi:hypothetical protein